MCVLCLTPGWAPRRCWPCLSRGSSFRSATRRTQVRGLVHRVGVVRGAGGAGGHTTITCMQGRSAGAGALKPQQSNHLAPLETGTPANRAAGPGAAAGERAGQPGLRGAVPLLPLQPHTDAGQLGVSRFGWGSGWRALLLHLLHLAPLHATPPSSLPHCLQPPPTSS